MLGQISPATLFSGTIISYARSLSHTFCVHIPLLSIVTCVFKSFKTFLDKGFYDLFVRSTRSSVVCKRLLKLSHGVGALPFFVLRFHPAFTEV